jgi:hypothetical protein
MSQTSLCTYCRLWAPSESKIKYISHTYSCYNKCQKCPPPQVLVGTMCMYMPDLICKDMRKFSPMDALDKFRRGAKWNSGSLYVSYVHTIQQMYCLHAPSRTLWNGSHIALDDASLCLSLELILSNPFYFCQHTQHFSWQENTCQNTMTDEKYRIPLATSSTPHLEIIHLIIQWIYGIFSGSKAAGGWGWPKILPYLP